MAVVLVGLVVGVVNIVLLAGVVDLGQSVERIVFEFNPVSAGALVLDQIAVAVVVLDDGAGGGAVLLDHVAEAIANVVRGVVVRGRSCASCTHGTGTSLSCVDDRRDMPAGAVRILGGIARRVDQFEQRVLGVVARPGGVGAGGLRRVLVAFAGFDQVAAGVVGKGGL